MTKYILAGGADRKFPSYGRNLAVEVFKSIKKPTKILSCFFAAPREDWEGKFAERQEWFHDTFGEDAKIVLAMPDTFLAQIKEVDIIYLHGGDETLLAHYLDGYGGLGQAWQGKIIVGTSAGAEYLARDYWTCDWRQVKTGKGLVDLHVITHFDSEEYGKSDSRGPIDWEAAQDELQATLEPGEEITILREGEFVVVER